MSQSPGNEEKGTLRQRLHELAAPLHYRDFRRLWLAQVFSELGDWAGRLALSVLVAAQTGSPVLTALVTTAGVIPYIGLGQVLAAWTNRFPRVRVIVITDIGRGAIFFVLAAAHLPVGAILVLAFVAGCLTPPFEAARNALTPLSVPTDRYGAAVAVAGITFDAAVLVGYAGGGALLVVLGTRVALALNACSFIASAAILSTIAVARRAPTEGAKVRVRDGWRVLVDDVFIRRFFISYTVVASCAVVGESLVAIYALDQLGSTSWTGALAVAIPLGAIGATVLARPRGDNTARMRLASQVALLGAVVGVGVFVGAPDLPFVVIGFAAIGMLNASRIPANEIAVLRVDDQLRGPAFTVFQGFVLGGQAVMAAIGGVVAHSLGVRETILLSLLVAGVVGLWGTLRPPHELRHAKSWSATTQTSD